MHLWSTIEINVAIMCACMPAMRQILVWLFPVVFGGATTLRGRYYYNNGNNNYGSGATPPAPKGHVHHHHLHPHRCCCSAPRRRSGSWGGDRLAPHHHQQQQQQQLGSESRVALARPGHRDFGGGVGVKEIIVQRSFEVQDEESPGSPVQMTEFVSTHKSGNE